MHNLGDKCLCDKINLDLTKWNKKKKKPNNSLNHLANFDQFMFEVNFIQFGVLNSPKS